MSKIYIGTSGYNYDHWKEVFYPKDLPKKDWLSFYSKHFKTVEINATFYGNFKKEVFERWANEVPPRFIFCLKGPRFITHVKRLKDPKDPLKNFLYNASGLGRKLKIILWQFPQSFKFNEENFERLNNFCSETVHLRGVLRVTSEVSHVKSAFEFRDKSWFNSEVYELLNKYQCGFVIADAPNFPKKEITTGNFSYIRFHGSLLLYSSNYTSKELKSWAKKIIRQLADKKIKDVYCYFNNDVSGFAVKNAKELVQLLR